MATPYSCARNASVIKAMPPQIAGATSSPPNSVAFGGPCSVSSAAASSPGSTTSTTSPASVSYVLDTAITPPASSNGHGIGYDSTQPTRTAHSTAAAAPGKSTAPAKEASVKEAELQRKRARDRKSQQAMRDRTKWTIFNLNEQVAFLTQMLSDRARDINLLNTRMRMLETENAQLRAQNAALQLSLMGSQARGDVLNDPATAEAAASAADSTALAAVPVNTVSAAGPGSLQGAAAAAKPERVKKPWEIPPAEASPTCLSDQILQNFITSKVHQRSVDGALTFGPPNLCSLLEKGRRTSDAISDICGDIVRSYFEIDTLPKQVAVFYIMWSLLKWMVLLDKPSWDLLPTWLRPTRAQVATPHAAWIDRIPW